MDHHKACLGAARKGKLNRPAFAWVEGPSRLQHDVGATLPAFPEAGAGFRLPRGETGLAEQGVLVQHLLRRLVPDTAVSGEQTVLDRRQRDESGGCLVAFKEVGYRLPSFDGEDSPD